MSYQSMRKNIFVRCPPSFIPDFHAETFPSMSFLAKYHPVTCMFYFSIFFSGLSLWHTSDPHVCAFRFYSPIENLSVTSLFNLDIGAEKGQSRFILCIPRRSFKGRYIFIYPLGP